MKSLKWIIIVLLVACNSHSTNTQNCNFDSLSTDSQVSKLAKDIFLDKEWSLENDDLALAMLDSLEAVNKSNRPFYFKVVTKTYKKADGYFSEGLGLAGKEYVENNTSEFAGYFDNKDCFSENDLSTWADIVILEFSISAEGKDDLIVDQYVKKLGSNCIACSKNQKETIDRFSRLVLTKWKDYITSQQP